MSIYCVLQVKCWDLEQNKVVSQIPEHGLMQYSAEHVDLDWVHWAHTHTVAFFLSLSLFLSPSKVRLSGWVKKNIPVTQPGSARSPSLCQAKPQVWHPSGYKSCNQVKAIARQHQDKFFKKTAKTLSGKRDTKQPAGNHQEKKVLRDEEWGRRMRNSSGTRTDRTDRTDLLGTRNEVRRRRDGCLLCLLCSRGAGKQTIQAFPTETWSS